MSMQLSSSAFTHNGNMPSQYTCDESDISPPLNWSEVPPQAKSLVLIVDDPDAPDPAAPKRTWVHWLLYNLPTHTTGLIEGVQDLPDHTREGMNDWQRTGYGGPCPPIGRHRYFFKLYALDITLDLAGTPTKAELEQAMQNHVLAQATLIGMYQRAGK